MCIICIEFLKGRLSSDEALRAAKEVIVSSNDPEEVDHAYDIIRINKPVEDIIEDLNGVTRGID